MEERKYYCRFYAKTVRAFGSYVLQTGEGIRKKRVTEYLLTAKKTGKNVILGWIVKSQLIKKIESHESILKKIKDGINGEPHNILPGTQSKLFYKTLEYLDIEIMTLTQAKKKKLVLKEGAQPIAYKQYKASVNDSYPIYLKIQFT